MNEQEIILSALKKKYFELLSKETYPKTPAITEEADKIEGMINKILNDQRANKA